MRKLTLILCISFLSAGSAIALSMQQKNEVNSSIILDSNHIEYDLGNLEKNTIVKTKMIIKNKLFEHVSIKEVISSCECMEVFVDPIDIVSDEEFCIDVAYDTHGIEGKHESTVYIQTDSKDYKFIFLKISLFVQ